MSDSPPHDARERIYLATLALIDEVGASRITTRAIAAAAGVNVASINYYYRSKDILLAEVLKASWEHTIGDLRAFLAREPWDPAVCLGELADYLLVGGQSHPMVTRAHFLGVDGGSGEGQLCRFGAGPGLKGLIEEIAARLASARSLPCDETLVLRTASFVASLIYPVLLPEAFPALSTPESLRLYRDIVLAGYLGEEGRPA
jgi:AcrR family transcriptional regulator